MMFFPEFSDVIKDTQTRLIRDRALDEWRTDGCEYQVRKVRGTQEFSELLKKKLLEESFEVIHAGYEELPYELADVLAVLQGIAYRNSISWEVVLELARQKESGTGSFMRGMVWDRTIVKQQNGSEIGH